MPQMFVDMQDSKMIKLVSKIENELFDMILISYLAKEKTLFLYNARPLYILGRGVMHGRFFIVFV